MDIAVLTSAVASGIAPRLIIIFVQIAIIGIFAIGITVAVRCVICRVVTGVYKISGIRRKHQNFGVHRFSVRGGYRLIYIRPIRSSVKFGYHFRSERPLSVKTTVEIAAQTVHPRH